LSRANLEGTLFIEANLESANFEGAKLSGANFSAADLRGTGLNLEDIKLAIVDEHTLLNANLAISTATQRSPFAVLSAVDRLSKAKPGEVQEIAASQIELLSNYYEQVLEQAKKSFVWALIAAGIGLLFFLSAAGFLVYRSHQTVAIINTISGVLVEFISGIN